MWNCKFLEENIGKKLHDTGLDSDFIDMSTKAKIGKWGYIKLKSFCTTKENISRVKKQPTEWEQIFANYLSDKRLISKMYKELSQLYSKKTNNLILKWAWTDISPKKRYKWPTVCEKMLNLNNRQKKANQYHYEILSYTY